MSPFVSWQVRKGKLREERARLIVRLRDEQHLAFWQIAAQVGMSLDRCSRIYHKAKAEEEKK